MQFSPAPKLGSTPRLAMTALVTALLAAAALGAVYHDLGRTLGDTDDAMRLVQVRGLLHGGGWYDQLVTRLQPPVGVYMHWSRLLDGILAGSAWLLAHVMSPAAAETTVRFAWPLLLIGPAMGASLVMSRRLGGESAVFIGAVMLLANMELYSQFRPGRIDHHNVQILMAVIVSACALSQDRGGPEGSGRGIWPAIGAGLATGFGLAIGIEALVFLALVGASFALRLILDPGQARRTRAYALALAGSATGLFLIQTPPWRWSLSVCDALGINLIAAIAVSGLGLAASAAWAAGKSLPVRAAAVGGVGIAALAVYLALDPACVHGPFASVDPRLNSIWFGSIQELMPWPRLLASDPKDGLRAIIIGLSALTGALWLAVQAIRQRDLGKGLAVVLTLAAVAESALAYRAEDYAIWFGVPVIAAGLADLCRRLWRDGMVPTVATALILSPCTLATAASLTLPHRAGSPPSQASGTAGADHCLDTAAYSPLAALPPGLVLGEIDLGSFVLAHTPHSAMSAPYHRMSFGIWAAHQALADPPAVAEGQVRRLKATYVVVCPAHVPADPPRSLSHALARGTAPAWLEPLSPGTAPLWIYRVRPPGM